MDFKDIYRHGTYNLIGSILRHYGLAGGEPLPVIDHYLTKNYRNVFILLMDGLSVKLVRTSEFLSRHLADEIYSVFPSTTTASLTTLYSGLSPIEHGWMGWNVYLPELPYDGVTLLLNTVMNSDQPAADYHVGHELLGYRSIFDRISQTGTHVLHTSPFTDTGARSVDHLLNHLYEHAQRPGQNFGFGYWTEPDYTQHQHGAMSPQALKVVRDLEESLKIWRELLSDTLLIVMSDHGMIDSTPVYLSDYPELYDLLRREISFEPRNPSFFIKDGQREKFSDKFRELLPDFDLYTHEQVLASGMYGPGTPHPSTEHSIGDFVAVARGTRRLHHDRAKAVDFIGVHAGLTREEMMVPLIIFECP